MADRWLIVDCGRRMPAGIGRGTSCCYVRSPPVSAVDGWFGPSLCGYMGVRSPRWHPTWNRWAVRRPYEPGCTVPWLPSASVSQPNCGRHCAIRPIGAWLVGRPSRSWSATVARPHCLPITRSAWPGRHGRVCMARSPSADTWSDRVGHGQWVDGVGMGSGSMGSAWAGGSMGLAWAVGRWGWHGQWGRDGGLWQVPFSCKGLLIPCRRHDSHIRPLLERP